MCITPSTTTASAIKRSAGNCPYQQHGATTTVGHVQPATTTTRPPAQAYSHKKDSNGKQQQRCVYGYFGSFDNAIKPLLLVYLIGSALGTLFFAVFSQDATRPFVLSTCGHLIPEVILWTHMIFPPATTRFNAKAMWFVRSIYGVGFAIFCLWPTNNSNHNKIGPVITATYMLLSGVSDFLAFWLGLLFVARRTHSGVRKLGIAFLIHGGAFHFMAYEFFCPNKAELWGGLPVLAGMGWILLLLITAFAFFVSILPTLKEPLDLREQAPTPYERKFLMGGVLTSFLLLPPLAAGSPEAATAYLPHLLSNPTFFEPQSTWVALPYKIGFPLLSLILTTRVLITYVDAGLPILPITTTTTTTTTTLPPPPPPQQQHTSKSQRAIS